MGSEARRLALGRSKKSVPPVLSHEFVIQNHGDIISSVLMLFMLGFMFQPTIPIAQLFIFPQYNNTITLPNETESKTFYTNGVRDIPALLFYLCTWIAVHCVLQEYFIDKIQRRLHLSRTRQVQFNESGHLSAFSVYSVIHSGYILYEMGIHKDVTLLWVGYPEVHKYLTLSSKLFYLFQISFWAHEIPEFYFQKLRREEITERLHYCIPFLGFISIAYFLNFNRVGLALLFFEYFSRGLFHLGRIVYFSGKVSSSWTAFKLWNIFSPVIRLATIVVSVLTFWYGFRSLETPYIDVLSGNFNTRVVRLNCLVSVLLIQLFMVYKFSHFQLSHFRQRSRLNNALQPKKNKAPAAKAKKSRTDELNTAGNSKKQK